MLKVYPICSGTPRTPGRFGALPMFTPCQLHDDLVIFVPNQQATHQAVSKCTVTSRPLGGALHCLVSHNIATQVALTQSRPNIESDQ